MNERATASSINEHVICCHDCEHFPALLFRCHCLRNLIVCVECTSVAVCVILSVSFHLLFCFVFHFSFLFSLCLVLAVLCVSVHIHIRHLSSIFCDLCVSCDEETVVLIAICLQYTSHITMSFPLDCSHWVTSVIVCLSVRHVHAYVHSFAFS